MEKKTIVQQGIGYFVIAVGLVLIPLMRNAGATDYRIAAWVCLVLTAGIGVTFWPSFHPNATRAGKIGVGIVRGFGCFWLISALLACIGADFFGDDTVPFALTLAAACYFLLFTMPRKRKGRPRNPGFLSYFFGGIGALADVGNNTKKRQKSPSILEIRAMERANFLNSIDCAEAVQLKHSSGLPLANGSVCTVGIGKLYFLFLKDEMRIQLPMERVMDVLIKSEEETVRHFKNTFSGMLEPTSETHIRREFIITYLDNAEIKHLYFDCTDSKEAARIVEIWKGLPTAKKLVDL